MFVLVLFPEHKENRLPKRYQQSGLVNVAACAEPAGASGVGQWKAKEKVWSAVTVTRGSEGRSGLLNSCSHGQNIEPM